MSIEILRNVPLTASVILLVSCRFAASQLLLEIDMSSHESVERCPIVLRASLTNGDASPVSGPLLPADLESFRRLISVLITDEQRHITRLPIQWGTSGPHVTQVEPPMDFEFPSGGTISADLVIAPIIQSPPPPRWAGKSEERFAFLAPGSYNIRIEIYWGENKEIRSESIGLRILPANEADAIARDRLAYRHTAFLTGGDSPPTLADYERDSGGRVDLSRFRELQSILVDFPNSSYAAWIRFWKLHYHGPERDMLRYARDHRDFPLSDNLMMGAAEACFQKREYGLARETVDELLRLFPDGDTKSSAERLRSQLPER